MAAKDRNELTAGVFVVVSLVLLLVVVLWVGTSGLFQRAHQEAVFYVPDEINPGLEAGNNVTVGGVLVGRIVEVELKVDQERAYYIVEIFNSAVTVRADSKAHVSAGLVGEPTLTVTLGGDDQPPADWDHPVKIGGGMDQILHQLAVTSEKLRETAERELDPEKPDSLISKLHGITGNLETITANIVPQTDVTDPESLLAQLNSGMRNVNQLARKLFDSADNLSRTLATAGEVMAMVRDGQGSLGKLVTDDRLHRQLLDTTEQLTLLMQDMRALLQKWKATGIEMKLK